MRLGVAALAAVLVGCGTAPGVQVAAAVSLQEPLEDLAAGDPEIRFHLASSGVILRQALEGAPFDVVVLAGSPEMDRLEAAGALAPGTRTVVATNGLVLAVPAWDEPVASLQDLTRPRFARIAIGSPATVPVGRYGMEALQHAGLWNALQDRLVLAGHAEQVVEYLEREEVDAGLIYRSDAVSSAGVRICAAIDPAWHEPIRYEAAVLRETVHPAAARRFLERLAGPRGEVALRRHGFGPSAGR
ncbi:MAG: molybdate ABC transporter substrate-binding protein [Acidobacteriota bacterium]|jgi:molybdate transport system substrate-binding protein